jgi:hypothetical protein
VKIRATTIAVSALYVKVRRISGVVRIGTPVPETPAGWRVRCIEDTYCSFFVAGQFVAAVGRMLTGDDRRAIEFCEQPLRGGDLVLRAADRQRPL